MAEAQAITYMERPMKKLCIVLALAAMATAALAGTTTIKATRNYCNLEVREGKSNNPDANAAVSSGAVQAGWSYTGSDGTYVCYRREGNPGVCPSGMGYWVCNSTSVSGNENHDIY